MYSQVDKTVLQAKMGSTACSTEYGAVYIEMKDTVPTIMYITVTVTSYLHLLRHFYTLLACIVFWVWSGSSQRKPDKKIRNLCYSTR
jgi:hypothetical protein